jgi:hypothetical protein
VKVEADLVSNDPFYLAYDIQDVVSPDEDYFIPGGKRPSTGVNGDASWNAPAQIRSREREDDVLASGNDLVCKGNLIGRLMIRKPWFLAIVLAAICRQSNRLRPALVYEVWKESWVTDRYVGAPWVPCEQFKGV